MSTKLKRVATLAAGGTPSVDDPAMWETEVGEGLPWTSIGDMSDGVAVLATSRSVTPLGVADKRLPVGDVGTLLFAMYASVGAVGELGIRATWNQALLGISPRPGLAHSRFIRYWLEYLRPSLGALSRSNTQDNLNADQVGNFPFPLIDVPEQRAISDYLDAETARIDALIAKKQQLIHLLEERSNAEIRLEIGKSQLVGRDGSKSVALNRVVERRIEWETEGEMITAFRDGQVTIRSARGRDGFTDSWTDGSKVKQVATGDVVVHGLDGFAGAIGDSEADGVCSPVYHVLRPVDGDSACLGRMLQLLALDGYLGNFAVSTRERAVDFRNWDLFGRIPVPVLAPSQQKRIGDRIRAVRPLRKLVEQSEALALERRQALITAAVTGEFKVPGGA